MVRLTIRKAIRPHQITYLLRLQGTLTVANIEIIVTQSELVAASIHVSTVVAIFNAMIFASCAKLIPIEHKKSLSTETFRRNKINCSGFPLPKSAIFV